MHCVGVIEPSHHDSGCALAVFTFFLAALATLNQTPAGLRATDIINLALSARTPLDNHYHLVLSVRSFRTVQKNTMVLSRKLEIWVDGDKRRTDVKPQDDSNDKSREIWCRNCERQGYCFMTITGKDNMKMVVGFQPVAGQLDKADPYRIDWRRLGQLHGPMGTYLVDPPDTTLRKFSKLTSAVREINHDGARCYELSARPKNPGDTFRCVVAPDLGCNLVLSELVSAASGWRTTLTTQYAPTVSGVWYPKSVVYSQVRSGQETLREVITVERAEFNVPIAEETFRLSGLGLEEGQPIGFPEIKNNSNWPTWGKDNKLNTTNTAGKQTAKARQQLLTTAPPPAPDVPPPDRRAYYAAAALVALAAVAFTFARRTRKT